MIGFVNLTHSNMVEAEAEASAVQPAAGDHPQQEAAAGSEALPRTASSKRRSRWGGETEKGLQVLQEVARAEDSVAVPAAAPASTSPGPAAEEEPAAKRRKSRWGPEEPKPASIIAGLPVALPSSLAYLVDVSPEVFDLQQRLAVVRGMRLMIAAEEWTPAHAACTEAVYVFGLWSRKWTWRYSCSLQQC